MQYKILQNKLLQKLLACQGAEIYCILMLQLRMIILYYGVDDLELMIFLTEVDLIPN